MTDYTLLTAQLRAFAEEDGWYLPLLSNASALLWEALPSINWAGFYVLKGGRLTLGPFQGKTACIHIAPGKGVCGTALAKDETLLVPNVHEFPGHIACDSASNSEIVVPLHAGGKAVAVLDIDSPLLNRFDEADRAGLEAFAKAIEETIQFDL
ncbi:MAG: GAF domain-containing protein [Clostridia bacterium]|nr:GAF domain-containing protein [Clostridia bacterium]